MMRMSCAIAEVLEQRLLMAATTVDVSGVQPAALDQPRINLAISRTLKGDPLSGDTGAGSTFNVEAFYDTGSSGVVFSSDTATALGINAETYKGTPVSFNDTGVAGGDSMGVTEALFLGLAPYNPNADLDNPGTASTVYNQTFGPLRTEINSSPEFNDELTGDIDIVGMPATQGKVVVMDARPVNTFEDTMRTYVYNPGTKYNKKKAATNPGIPATNLHVALTYANFNRFSSLSPSRAAGPTLNDNPIIGPNPIAKIDSKIPAGKNPGITIARGSKSAAGSWLFDTGAVSSFISKAQASTLGVSYKKGTFGTDNPILVDSRGKAVAGQFTEAIGGVGGATTVAGFFLDSLSVPTQEGTPLRFLKAPVLVTDITVQDSITKKTLTLDGDFGMNFLVASADVTGGFPGNLAPGAFDWLTFDQPKGVLGINFPGLKTAIATSATVTRSSAALRGIPFAAAPLKFAGVDALNAVLGSDRCDGSWLT